MPLSPLGLSSRYKDTQYARIRHTSYYGLWRRPSELAQMRVSSSKVHTVRDGNVGRLDRISYEEYDTVGFWWVIAAVNDIIDPRTDMSVGQRLLIPDFADVAVFRQRAGLVK